MKGLLFVIGIIALVGATAERLDDKTVHDLIERVKTLNGIKRQLHTAKKNLNSPLECPLAKYHNKRWLTADPTEERNAHALFAARNILLEAGYTTDDLNAREVREEFLRQAGSDCDETPQCDESDPYRKADGSCNNIVNPKWGSTGSPQGRLLQAVYFDGTTAPRNTSVDNEPLPNPRKISNDVHKPVGGSVRSDTINLHTFQMGQFLDHDITLTPTQTDVLDCCSDENRLDTDNCIPIVFPKSREEIGFFRGRDNEEVCMNVHRSVPHPCEAAAGNREQINNITAFVDCSNVYGSTLEEQQALRDGAFMKIDKKYWLPKDDSSLGCELDGETGVTCNLAGDHRVNTVPSLAAYHILFAMEHNRIAGELESEYPDDEEKLFQETRRILIAVMQKIVYDEFLTSFISAEAMSQYNLLSDADYTYDSTIDPSISNEFAIAYRFGHTWIPRTMDRFDTGFDRLEGIRTRNSFGNMTMTYFGYSDATDSTPPADVGPSQLAYWLTGELSAETDGIVEEEVRSFLFQNTALESAFDLVALNIQRGRDHGLNSFTAYRELCGLGAVTDFADLTDHTDVVRTLLQQAYNDPRDIDLFTGVVTEGLETGVLGPTLECILGQQFRNLKFGDRFWYQGQAAGFNEEQLAAIRDYSMSAVLCNNFGFERVDFPNAFVRSRKQRCSRIDGLNLAPFMPNTASTKRQGRVQTIEDILQEKERQILEEMLERELQEQH